MSTQTQAAEPPKQSVKLVEGGARGEQRKILAQTVDSAHLCQSYTVVRHYMPHATGPTGHSRSVKKGDPKTNKDRPLLRLSQHIIGPAPTKQRPQTLAVFADQFRGKPSRGKKNTPLGR
jgi:hypothetical protein